MTASPKQFFHFQIISTFFKYLVLRPLIYLLNSYICSKETIILINQILSLNVLLNLELGLS